MLRICVLFFVGLLTVKSQMMAQKNSKSTVYKSITVDTLFKDVISIRAIVLDQGKLWYAGDQNRFGYYDLNTKTRFENKIVEGNLKLEFRSIAKTRDHIFILSVGSPALLYQISKDAKSYQLVYQEKGEKVFYDSMQFFDEKWGIAVGDPLTDRLSVIRTTDAGKTWHKLPEETMPKVFDGEAHFAASNSNIVIKGNRCWIVSGGKKARVFYSADKGNSWSVYPSPIVQGKEMTGIFTADFYDLKNGFISGGDYTLPNQNFGNKAVSSDGGKSWKLIAEKQGFGFGSCVQYVPKSKGRGIVVVGALGLYYSSDKGLNWSQLSKDPDLYSIRFLSSNTAIAAGRHKILRIVFGS